MGHYEETLIKIEERKPHPTYRAPPPDAEKQYAFSTGREILDELRLIKALLLDLRDAQKTK